MQMMVRNIVGPNTWQWVRLGFAPVDNTNLVKFFRLTSYIGRGGGRIMPGGGGGLIPGGGAIGGTPVGGIPGGIPRPIGIPGGGIPGGSPIAMPGGGTPGLMPGGAGGRPRPCGAIAEGAGPPTPRTGPCKPGGAPTMGGTATAGMPRPAARPRPGPGMVPARGTREIPSSGGGGPSTVSETMFCPRSKTKPNTRFSSRSIPLVPLPLILRNSSHSERIMFMCLSKALNVPMKVRLSCRITLMR